MRRLQFCVGMGILAMCGLLLFCGCTASFSNATPIVVESLAPAQAEEQESTSVPQKADKQLQYTPSAIGYQQLYTPAQRELYHAIEEQGTKITEVWQNNAFVCQSVYLPKTLSALDVRLVYCAFISDHPEYFWLTNSYGFQISDYDTQVQLYSYVSPSEQFTMEKELSAAIQAMLSQIDAEQSDYQQELSAFQLLANHVSYDHATTTSTGADFSWKSHTVYGALIDGKAVCEGYARTMQLLLGYLGIPCTVVTGQSQGESHMWNLVQLDEEWYHVDATWNDQETVLLYDFFNLTDAQIQTDHKMDQDLKTLLSLEQQGISQRDARFNLFTPQCTSTTWNYGKQTAIVLEHFHNIERERAMEQIQQAIAEKAPALYFSVADSLDFHNTVDLLFNTRNPLLLEYLQDASRSVPSNTLNTTTIRYTTNEAARMVTVVLQYQEE